MVKKSLEKPKTVRFNTIISGEPAAWLEDWKRRGLVRSNSDAIRVAFRALHDQILETDLKSQRVEA